MKKEESSVSSLQQYVGEVIRRRREEFIRAPESRDWRLPRRSRQSMQSRPVLTGAPNRWEILCGSSARSRDLSARILSANAIRDQIYAEIEAKDRLRWVSGRSPGPYGGMCVGHGPASKLCLNGESAAPAKT